MSDESRQACYERAERAEQERKDHNAKVERHQKINDCHRGAMIPARHRVATIAEAGPWWDKVQALQSHTGTGYLFSLIGKRGTGKTQLAVHLLLISCNAARLCLYAKEMDIFLDIRSSYDTKGLTEQVRVDYWVKTKLLVIDELQERGNSTWEDRMLVHIIDKRYDAQLDTILISNLTESRFESALGPSITSRIMECGGHVVCDWLSFRESKQAAHSSIPVADRMKGLEVTRD